MDTIDEKYRQPSSRNVLLGKKIKSNSMSAMDKRGSGVLLHISSLPSPFGVGDLGSGAYDFVDFLSAARQRFWQILPLNPSEYAFDHSPYHSYSVFAFNTLFISPELLREEGWLDR